MAAKNIVVIEDEENLVELIKINLRFRGMNVITEEYGEGGYNTVLKSMPDIVLLDAGLPDVDGWEICKRLKENSAVRHIPVIFVTAAAQERDKSRAKEVGADGFLAKPFEISELLNIINQYT